MIRAFFVVFLAFWTTAASAGSITGQTVDQAQAPKLATPIPDCSSQLQDRRARIAGEPVKEDNCNAPGSTQKVDASGNVLTDSIQGLSNTLDPNLKQESGAAPQPGFGRPRR